MEEMVAKIFLPMLLFSYLCPNSNYDGKYEIQTTIMYRGISAAIVV